MMTDREIDVLNKACQMTGTDPTKITAENPATKSGKTAQMLMMAAGEIDPEQAARWRVAAGATLSVSTLAEMQSGEQLSQAAMKDLWQHDPAFVVDWQQESARREQAQLQEMEQKADEARLRNKAREMGGDVDRAREALQAEDQRDAELKRQREVAAEHSRQMEQRLEQQRRQTRQMSGAQF